MNILWNCESDEIDWSITYQPKFVVILLGDKCPRWPEVHQFETHVKWVKYLERYFQISKHHLLSQRDN